MIRKINDKKAAMEMSVGTIVTIVLLMAVLVLGLTLTRTIFSNATRSVSDIDDGVRKEINNLFESENNNIVVRLGSQKTAKVKQGTQHFGIPIGYSPNNPQYWGPTKDECKYIVTASRDGNYCVRQGWTNPDPEDYIVSGVGSPGNGVHFDDFYDNNGYAIIFINIPENIPPCLQKFQINVECDRDTQHEEYVSTSFYIDVIKRGLF